MYYIGAWCFHMDIVGKKYTLESKLISFSLRDLLNVMY